MYCTSFQHLVGVVSGAAVGEDEGGFGGSERQHPDAAGRGAGEEPGEVQPANASCRHFSLGDTESHVISRMCKRNLADILTACTVVALPVSFNTNSNGYTNYTIFCKTLNYYFPPLSRLNGLFKFISVGILPAML